MNTRDREALQLSPPERDEDRIVPKDEVKRLLERFAKLPTKSQLNNTNNEGK